MAVPQSDLCAAAEWREMGAPAALARRDTPPMSQISRTATAGGRGVRVDAWFGPWDGTPVTASTPEVVVAATCRD
jgi:hypothetical protein